MRVEEIYKEKILQASYLKPLFKKNENPSNKTHLIYALIRYHLAHLPLLAEAYAQLKLIKSKKISIDKVDFEVNFNPLREKNVIVKTDRKTIESRNCFLCVSQLYKEQKGVILEDLFVTMNPRPIIPDHLTLLGKHESQHINSDVVLQALKLTSAIYPFRLLYNGPSVGASLPIHFHFQALPCELPVENPFLERKEINRKNEVNVYTLKFPSRVLVVEGNNSKAITNVISNILNEIEKMGYMDDEWCEHMINIWTSYSPEKNVYRVFIVPRSKHRPNDFGTGKDEIAISPGMLEMGGKIIVVNETTFNKTDEKLIRRILDEVSMLEDDFKKLVRNLSH